MVETQEETATDRLYITSLTRLPQCPSGMPPLPSDNSEAMSSIEDANVRNTPFRLHTRLGNHGWLRFTSQRTRYHHYPGAHSADAPLTPASNKCRNLAVGPGKALRYQHGMHGANREFRTALLFGEQRHEFGRIRVQP
jgi:hypothetical protein